MNEIKTIMSEILEGVEDLADIATNSPDLPDRIEAGSALWRISELSTKAVGPLKEALREVAVSILGGDGVWNGEGTGLGLAKVVVPAEALRVRKGADPQSHSSLPGWDEVFQVEQKVKVRTGATTAIAKMASGQERDRLLDLLESTSATPRVSLKRND